MKKLLLESAIVTAIIFGLMRAIVLMPLNFSALQPLENALEGFDMMDLYYSSFSATEGQFGKDVVLVNIGDANRAEIADLINIVGFGNPAAIGVDVFFPNKKEAFADSLLANAIANNPVVLGGYFQEENGALATSHPNIAKAQTGFTNFVGTDARYNTIRYFKPTEQVGGQRFLSFGLLLAKMADSSASAQFLTRASQSEIINYVGHENAFLHLEKDDLLRGKIDLDVLQEKVVIIGFMGENFSDDINFEDKFFTPLNPKISGRSVPDMNGAVLHANIVQMILSKNWINKMGDFLKWTFSILLTYFHVALFMFLIIRLNLYFDAIATILRIISSLILLFVVFQIYHHFHFRMFVASAIWGIALSVEVLFVYEAIAHTIYKKWKIKSILMS